MADKKKETNKKIVPVIIALILICAVLIICAVTGVFNKKDGGKPADTTKTETDVQTDENGETLPAAQSADQPAADQTAADQTAADQTAAQSSDQSDTAALDTAAPVGKDEQDASSKVGSNGAITPASNGPAETGIAAFSGNTSGSGSTGNYAYSFEKVTDEGVPPEGGKIAMELNYPVFTSGTVNVSPLNDEIAAKLTTTKDSYARMFSASDDESSETYCRFEVESKIVTANDSIVSVLMTTNTAIAASNTDTYTTVNYDVAASKVLHLYDLFPEDADYETKLAQSVGNSQIDTGKFLISPEGLTVFTVSPGSGTDQVTIPFSQLDGLMYNTYKIG